MSAASPFDPAFFERDPLFWPIAPAARAFSEYKEWPPVADYGSRVAHRASVAFREQAPRPRRKRRTETGPAELYDGRIALEGWVPTRPRSWHDFLNMLVWAAFPAAKQGLHGRQHRAMSARLASRAAPAEGVSPRARPLVLPNARTREQDALALMDEGGVLIACDPGRVEQLRAALRGRDEAEARALFASGSARAAVFGHAIFEGLVLGRADGWAAAFLVAHGGDLRDDASLVNAADAALAAALARDDTFQSTDYLVRADLSLLRPR